MKNFKFASVIDFIFVNFLIFLIIFTWSRFITKNLLLSLFLGLVSMGIFMFFNKFVSKSKKDKLVISKSLQKDIDGYFLTLLSNTKEQNLEFFASALKEENPEIFIEQNLIVCTLNAYCPLFNEEQLNVTNALKHIRFAIDKNLERITIICNNADDKTKLYLKEIKNIEVEILDKSNAYAKFFTIYQSYPKIIFESKPQKKLKFKQILNLSFCRSRCKNYFLSGLFILFCSMFVRLNFYYVFLSSLLFLFAIISLTKKQT